MKIEKINDNKIKCTLTSSDLESRQIRLSELAYGSEKAKQLFQDMMQQARNRFGFDSENAPLMIEAIPTSPDSITLIITKVEDPEELDTRFSRFSPSEEDSPAETKHPSGADSILDLFKRIHEARKNTEAGSGSAGSAAPDRRKNTPSEESSDEDSSLRLVQAFTFTRLDDVIKAAHSLKDFYSGCNSLFRDPDGYILVLHQAEESPERFNQVCNVLTEYGTNRQAGDAYEAFLLEHGDIIIKNRALQQLSAY